MPNAAATQVRERPILFSGPMVRAILDRRKTQTRRVIVDRAKDEDGWITTCPGEGFTPELVRRDFACPYGDPGDRLWVRETWASVPATAYRCSVEEDGSQVAHKESPDGYGWAIYRAGWTHCAPSWKPSIHMPRWASRLTLEITDVRVERVQSITDDDAWDEGCADFVGEPIDAGERWILPREAPRDEYRRLWDKLNAKRGYGWDANPWVWALTFMVVPQ